MYPHAKRPGEIAGETLVRQKNGDFAIIGKTKHIAVFVIPAKPRKTGREPESRSAWADLIFLDSGSRYASRRSSGMTAFLYFDIVSWRMDSTGRIIFPEH
jgi:hypothetical protein